MLYNESKHNILALVAKANKYQYLTEREEGGGRIFMDSLSSLIFQVLRFQSTPSILLVLGTDLAPNVKYNSMRQQRNRCSIIRELQ